MVSELQQWQRDRFMYKGRLAGLIANAYNLSKGRNISPDEKHHLSLAIGHLRHIRLEEGARTTRSQAKHRQTLKGRSTP